MLNLMAGTAFVFAILYLLYLTVYDDPDDQFPA
ncbi:hypothetical protein DFOLPJBN_000152 [Candidatus Liberibacter asiaticus]